MIWQIEIKSSKVKDSFCAKIEKSILELGMFKDVGVEFLRGYLIEADFSKDTILSVCNNVLCCPVTEEYNIYGFPYFEEEREWEFIARVLYNPGVTDPQEESIRGAIKDLVGEEPLEVATFRKYIFNGMITKAEFEILKKRILFNPLIEFVLTRGAAQNIKSLRKYKEVSYRFEMVTVPLERMDKEQMQRLSTDMQLYLDPAEMETIKGYFAARGRNPTDCELETLAQTWSEHCFHKTFKSLIDYREEADGRVKEEKIDSLFKTYIFKSTYDINHPSCVSVFKDNAGIVAFDDKYNLCFKVETHSHPSSLEPYGGASTGIGGVVRDILGAGKGAFPLCNTDIFCFAPPDYDFKDLPQGILHPRRIMRGVVEGVRDYGNKIGIPTVNGAVVFDERFLGNPLVYCGCLGIIPREYSFKKVKEGDVILVAGGKTGRDGIHGATFSSVQLDTMSHVVSGSCVQIGNPIEEKKLWEATIKARDQNLIEAITDCGAGGLSSAVGEITGDLGCRVNLDRVPLKYQGLSYTEIWISESQERMVLVVSPEDLDRIRKIFEDEKTEVTAIGEVTNTGRLELFYQGTKVCDLDMDFLHGGPSQREVNAVWKKKDLAEPQIEEQSDYNHELKNILSSYTVASKRWIVSQYDHEVQGHTVLKPFMLHQSSPQDASCIKPFFDSPQCIGVSCGINPFYSDIDPYWMAAACIDEAIRNLVCVGANPDKIFLLDNFSWADVKDEKILGDLVRACKACYEFSVDYKTPFISGKDSLNNFYNVGEKTISIPGTLLISGMGVIEDEADIVSSHFKQEGNLVYLLGLTRDELGGSRFYALNNVTGKHVPHLFPDMARHIYHCVYRGIKEKFIVSAHDISEGGLAVALAEMCFGTKLGIDVFLPEVKTYMPQEDMRDYIFLFSESPARIIVEVKRENREKFEQTLEEVPFGLIGCINNSSKIKVYGLKGNEVINEDIDVLEYAYHNAFREG